MHDDDEKILTTLFTGSVTDAAAALLGLARAGGGSVADMAKCLVERLAVVKREAEKKEYLDQRADHAMIAEYMADVARRINPRVPYGD